MMPGTGCQHRPLVIQPAHQDLDAVTDIAHHIFNRHFAILEHQFARIRTAHAELVELLSGRKSFKPLLYQKRGNTF